MDLVDGTGGLRRLWVALFSLRVSGDGGGLALTSFSPKIHKVHRHIVYRETFFSLTLISYIFMRYYTIDNMLLTSKLYFIHHTNVYSVYRLPAYKEALLLALISYIFN